MTDFEYIIVLYALLLGLSLVELLSGFGRTLERVFETDSDGQRFSIGWLTPLLGLFVILDLLSFWIFAWTIRSLLEVTPATLLGVILFAGAYYLAARLVFPTNPDRFKDLNNHYFRVHRTIMAILIGLVFVQWFYLLSFEQIRTQMLSPLNIGLTVMLVAMMGATLIFKNRHVQSVLLVALNLRYLVLYLL